MSLEYLFNNPKYKIPQHHGCVYIMINKANGLKIVIISCTLMLILTAFNFTIAHNLSSSSRGARNLIVGPIELVNNGDFDQNSDWTYDNGVDLLANYESSLKKANVTINEAAAPVWFGPAYVWDNASINQTVQKNIPTTSTPTAVKLSFDYAVVKFDGIFFGVATIVGYMRVYINQSQNPTPVIDKSVNLNNNVDWITETADVGNLMAGDGPYILSLQFQINVIVATGSWVTLNKCLVRVDNVSLNITDEYPPDVQVNQKNYGPHNSTDPGAIIDVDFDNGGGSNNTLDFGAYKINTSNEWIDVFTNDVDSHTDNWSLDWSKVNEGNNTVHLLCNDTIGNSNDTELFYIFKDTQLPQSQASSLPTYINTSSFMIPYISSDPAPSGGLHHVEVWYADFGTMNFNKYTDTTYTSGNFTENPITYNSTADGIYEFYTIAVDNANNRELPVPATPDTNTTIDTTPPTSKAGPLSKYQASLTFDIPYNSSDSLSGVDYVNLYYTDNDGQTWTKYQSGVECNFSSSPINFNAPSETKYGFYSVAFDNATNIELGSVPSTGTIPDVNTTIDTKAPHPKIITPANYTHHTGDALIVTAISNPDTKKIFFDYYNDTDNNSEPDDGNNWVTIGEDTIPGDGWSVNWNIANFESQFVMVRANATDYTGKTGEGKNIGIEIDHTHPSITITSPSYGDNFANTCEIKFTTSEDTAYVVFDYQKNNQWHTIDTVYNPEVSDSYMWVTNFGEVTVVDLRAFAYDDVGLDGFDIVKNITFGKNPPEIAEDFKSLTWTWNEDFGQVLRTLTDYEYDEEDSGENLKWYITGHNKSLYQISGHNRTDDTFTFSSILHVYGEETITFHLWDSDKLEDTIKVTVIITPINDAPKFSTDMSTSISVKADQPYPWDLSEYIEDVDNADNELILTTSDQTYIGVSDLTLNIEYPETMLDQTKTVDITVRDPWGLTDKKQVQIKISDNFPPEIIKPLPDLEFHEGETVNNYVDLDEYFMDQDGDVLTYSDNAQKVRVFIDDDGTVDFTAHDWSGVEIIIFTASDSRGSQDNTMRVTVIDINDPPVIAGIPDISVHYDVFVPFNLEDYILDDNDTRDLELWTPDKLKDNVKIDPFNNLALILWFPKFEIMPYQVTVHVQVSDGEFDDSDDFIVTVTEFYPILLKYPIEDIEFNEDTNFTDAFSLWDYFDDPDGGSHFEVEGYNTANLEVKITDADGLAMVSFYPAKDFYGYEKVTFIGKDTITNSKADDTITVHVLPVNDPPVIAEIPEIKIEAKQQTQFNLEEYLFDIDDAIYNLTVSTNDESIEVSGRVLTFNYTKAGKKTITLTVSDGKAQVTRDIVVIVEEEEIPSLLDQIIDNWWILLILIILILIIGSTAYTRLTRYSVEEVFLVHKSGILIAHRMRKSSTEYDEELVSGMFTAVQEFIKDTFSGRTDSDDEYTLEELKLGENNILLERGEYTYLAVIFSGRGTKKLRVKTIKLLKNIEKKYSEPLRNWFGDMDKFKGIDKMLMVLIPKEEALSEEEDPSKKGVDILGRVQPPPGPAPQPPTEPRPGPTPPSVQPQPQPKAPAPRPSTPAPQVKAPATGAPQPAPTPTPTPKPTPAPKPAIKPSTPPTPRIAGKPTQPRLPPPQE